MTSGTLILIRHGQTHDNTQNILTGRRDVDLTETGAAQAHAAGELLKNYKIDKVYSSPLKRAFNTAALALTAAGQTAVEIEKREEITEMDAGDFTGCAFAFNAAGLCTIGETKWGCIHTEKMPGGESDEDVVSRVRDFYTREVAPRLARGETVMVVGHVGILRAFDFALGIDPTPGKGEKTPFKLVPNATPVVYTYKDGGIRQQDGPRP